MLDPILLIDGDYSRIWCHGCAAWFSKHKDMALIRKNGKCRGCQPSRLIPA